MDTNVSDIDLADWEIEESQKIIASIKENTFRITHHYDLYNQDIYVERVQGDIDAKKAAFYCQFWAEKWFQEEGEAVVVSNFGIAAMLIAFYGFSHASNATELCNVIDLYHDRENSCGPNTALLLNDPTLARDGLKEAIFHYIEKM